MQSSSRDIHISCDEINASQVSYFPRAGAWAVLSTNATVLGVFKRKTREIFTQVGDELCFRTNNVL